MISTISVGGQTVSLVDLPAGGILDLNGVEFKGSDQVALVRSAFTGQVQAQKWPGADMLAGTMKLPPLTRAKAALWRASLLQLRGMANAFQMAPDPLAATPQGSGLGNPFVDNTQNGGNPAGSEFLGTKGWTANAQGVLKKGDWFQVGYRVYMALDDVNADGSGKALISIWPTLREAPSNDGTLASWVNATGAVTKFNSVTLGDYTYAAIWSNFAQPLRALPPDAVIQGIYPVVIASGTYDICFQTLAYGVGARPGGPGTGFGHPYATGPITPGATFASTQFWGSQTGPDSIGTSLADLAGQQIFIAIDSSLFMGPLTDALAATGVGFAIYYTSATPIVDPLMPPPFTVPSGQGLAWSVPLASSVSYQDLVNGTAASSPAAYNGLIQVNNPVGLFRRASNDQGWSTDVTRLSRMSFPIQEYR